MVYITSQGTVLGSGLAGGCDPAEVTWVKLSQGELERQGRCFEQEPPNFLERSYLSKAPSY